jgi:hypothetical protein
MKFCVRGVEWLITPHAFYRNGKSVRHLPLRVRYLLALATVGEALL